ncbi:MAG: MBL fold metallo-hydrolase [Ignavibacteria bacterium]|jgi:glyoxylase-like metal-dependent hydrolase (beta-lactamase superfamily II)|nr:MBL fold metallo-hydrolase [Ignavibacteria bacterium]MCU7504824.1 MBL fold metallo-hydrolase [Ignavibacteria bacterium]MCU7517710.1 MBL fold metallo-hydrolase [Ignavibacteria bacterium]
MKIGKYKLEILEAGSFALDGGAMFGIIPKPLWEKSNPADEKNRIRLNTRCLLLTSDDKKVLVDTGMGDKWDEKSHSIYEIKSPSGTIAALLSAKGVYPEEITDVILTHCHFDHAGGATSYDDGKLLPAFPNAGYYIQKQNLNWALNPSDRDKGSYIKQNFVPLLEQGVLKFLEGNSSFDDEIELLQVNGHTFGQQLVKVSSGGDTFLYCGDLIPLASHIHLPYIMGYDLQPLITLEEKKEILTKAAEENWKLIFEHDPFSACATVMITDKGFKIKERFDIS